MDINIEYESIINLISDYRRIHEKMEESMNVGNTLSGEFIDLWESEAFSTYKDLHDYVSVDADVEYTRMEYAMQELEYMLEDSEDIDECAAKNAR